MTDDCLKCGEVMPRNRRGSRYCSIECAYRDAVDLAKARFADFPDSPGAEFVMPPLDFLDNDVLEQYLTDRALNLQVRQRLAEQVRRGQNITSAKLRDFAARAILMEPLPQRTAGRPVDYSDDYLRKAAILGAVFDIVQSGMLRRTRNEDAKKENKYSACDAVVEAARFYRVELTYDQVRKRTER